VGRGGREVRGGVGGMDVGVGVEDGRLRGWEWRCRLSQFQLRPLLWIKRPDGGWEYFGRGRKALGVRSLEVVKHRIGLVLSTPVVDMTSNPEIRYQLHQYNILYSTALFLGTAWLGFLTQR